MAQKGPEGRKAVEDVLKFRDSQEVLEDLKILTYKQRLECEHCDGSGEYRSLLVPSGHVTDVCEWCEGTGFKKPPQKMDARLRAEHKKRLNMILQRLLVDMYGLVSVEQPELELDETWFEASNRACRVLEASLLESTKRVSSALGIEEYLMHRPPKPIFKLDSDG